MRNVLIFSGSHSHSSQDAGNPGSRISVHLARHLVRHGWRPVVVTQYKNDGTDQAPIKLNEIPAYVSSQNENNELLLHIQSEKSFGKWLIHSSKRLHDFQFGGKAMRPVWNAIATGLTGLARFLGDSHESGGGWSSVAARAGMKVAQTIRVDAMIAITGWDAPFAACRCHRATCIPWIQIFHDPWQGFIKPVGRPFLGIYLDHLILRSAAALAHCTPAWARDLEKELGRPVTCLVNAYDAEQMANSRPQQFDRFTVIYSGTVEPEVRDPRVFFAGMALLRSEMPTLADKLQVIYIGSQGDFLQKRAKEHGVSDLVQSVGSLSAFEVLPYIRGAHLLLMLLDQTNPFDMGRLGSKSAEYIGSGRPILLVSRTREGKETDLIRLVRDTGAGWVVHTDEKVADVLRRLLEQYTASGDTLSPGQGRFAAGDLTYERQAQKLGSLLERIASGEEDPVLENFAIDYPWSEAK